MSDEMNATETEASWDDEIFAEFVSSVDAVADEGIVDAPSQLPQALTDLLAQVDQSEGVEPDTASHQNTTTGLQEDSETSTASPGDVQSDSAKIEPAAIGSVESPELAEAFREDAGRGIVSLEEAVIEYESSHHEDEEALGQIRRELHTLKGAAGVVGLSDVARYLHDIEDLLDSVNATPLAITEVLIDCIETLRNQVGALQPHEARSQSEQASNPASQLDFTAEKGDQSISVKVEQLDRLLDMLTGLTLLNNQRESFINQLNNYNANLGQCGNRLRDLDREFAKSSSSNSLTWMRSSSNPLREVANDLAEIGNALRESYGFIVNEHTAVSGFIMNFRKALVSILRTPVSGLFRRLQRVALDAARVENKQVKLVLIGSDAGLERSVQERLVDPLMHIVRNAVGHGIEIPSERAKAGKDPTGTITLEATSTPNLLTLSVRDDGRGLDYEALRNRGLKLGLIPDGGDVSKKDLAQLIFHRGFSTREQANEVAGRGVGMDVVADTLEKMHAWLDIDSEPGDGTNIKITVPLKSISEHVLIVRCGEHVLAVPMQFAQAADDAESEGVASIPSLGDVLGIPDSHEASTVVNIGRESSANVTTSRSARFLVDEILGPQEVVVRPLPPLLRSHQLFTGVTLASNGHVVYVLDPARLANVLANAPNAPKAAVRSDQPQSPRVLVIDDSLSARRAVSQLCHKMGWEVVEAIDGEKGLEQFVQGDWKAVFVDFDMPRVNGMRFAEGARASGDAKTPIYMISSRAPEELEAEALEAGVTRYLTKPMTSEAFDNLFASENSKESV